MLEVDQVSSVAGGGKKNLNLIDAQKKKTCTLKIGGIYIKKENYFHAGVI